MNSFIYSEAISTFNEAGDTQVKSGYGHSNKGLAGTTTSNVALYKTSSTRDPENQDATVTTNVLLSQSTGSTIKDSKGTSYSEPIIKITSKDIFGVTNRPDGGTFSYWISLETGISASLKTRVVTADIQSVEYRIAAGTQTAEVTEEAGDYEEGFYTVKVTNYSKVSTTTETTYISAYTTSQSDSSSPKYLTYQTATTTEVGTTTESSIATATEVKYSTEEFEDSRHTRIITQTIHFLPNWEDGVLIVSNADTFYTTESFSQVVKEVKKKFQIDYQSPDGTGVSVTRAKLKTSTVSWDQIDWKREFTSAEITTFSNNSFWEPTTSKRDFLQNLKGEKSQTQTEFPYFDGSDKWPEHKISYTYSTTTSKGTYISSTNFYIDQSYADAELSQTVNEYVVTSAKVTYETTTVSSGTYVNATTNADNPATRSSYEDVLIVVQENDNFVFETYFNSNPVINVGLKQTVISPLHALWSPNCRVTESQNPAFANSTILENYPQWATQNVISPVFFTKNPISSSCNTSSDSSASSTTSFSTTTVSKWKASITNQDTIVSLTINTIDSESYTTTSFSEKISYGGESKSNTLIIGRGFYHGYLEYRFLQLVGGYKNNKPIEIIALSPDMKYTKANSSSSTTYAGSLTYHQTIASGEAIYAEEKIRLPSFIGAPALFQANFKYRNV